MIPFSLIPEKPLYIISKSFKAIGNFIASFFPLLQAWLKQAEYAYSPREFSAIAFAAGLFNALFLIALVSLAGYIVQRDLIVLSLAIGLLMSLLTMVSILAYPAVVSIRRARQIDVNLINAVRQVLIELRSGVTLFSAIASVTTDYGEASQEFKKIIGQIEGGVPEADALADASASTPSNGMKKVLWQISNALKVGSDVSLALEAQLEDLTSERLEQIRRYGQELSPWTMMYMLAAIIIPSLGVTMLIVLSTFLNAAIPSLIFPVTIFIMILFQLFFMNFVGTRRPAI